MNATTNRNRAASLVTALAAIGLEGEQRVNHRGGTKDYVCVWTPDDTRYPSATVWVDEDGYTWGHSFEHNRHEHTATTVVAAAIKDSLSSDSKA